MRAKKFEYHDNNVRLLGFLCEPADAENAPVVLVCPDWSGCNAFAMQTAETLAEMGYLGFAVDIYGNGQIGANNDEKMQLMQPFMQDRAYLQQRLLAAFAAAKALPQSDNHRIAVIGFCFGGLCALDLARCGAKIKGAVSFHGILSAPETTLQNAIDAKILVLHGYDDPMVPPEDLLSFANEMTARQADWQIHAYGNTRHAFTNPEANNPSFGTVYNETAKRRSVLTMRHFLAEIFNQQEE